MGLKLPKLKISTNSLIIVIICFVFLPPPFVSSIPSISVLLWYIKLLLMMYIIFKISTNYKGLGLGTIVLGLYLFTFVLTTIINNGNVSKSLSAVLPQFCFFAYADLMLHKKTRLYINTVSSFLATYIVINALMLLIFPVGIGAYLPGYDYLRVDSRMSWLGLDNGYIKYFLIAFVVFFFSYKDRPFKRNMLYMCMLASMLFVWSGTGVIGLSIMMVYVYLVNRGKLAKSVNYWLCLILGVIAFFSIVIFRIAEYFSDFIINVLGKDITFTGRTILWDQALLLIAKRPVCGYGVYDYDLLVSAANGQAYSAHDTVLQLMLMGGLISLIGFFIVVIVAGVQIEKNGKRIINHVAMEKGIVCIAIFVMWICGITENMVFDIQLYFLFLLGINLPYIISAFQTDDISLQPGKRREAE